MNYDKPGCFGNAVTYNNRSKTCIECEHTDSCALAARQRIEELRQMVSVDSILKLAHKPKEKASRRLPDSADSIVASMSARQRKTVEVLIDLDNPTPLILVERLMQKLKWSKDEAVQVARETMIVLVKNNLASVEGGRIILRC